MTRNVYLECERLINKIGGISAVMVTKHPDLVHEGNDIDECLDELHDIFYEELEN